MARKYVYRPKGIETRKLSIDPKDVVVVSEEEKSEIINNINYKKQLIKLIVFIVLFVASCFAFNYIDAISNPPTFMDTIIIVVIGTALIGSIIFGLLAYSNIRRIKAVKNKELCYFVGKVAGKLETYTFRGEFVDDIYYIYIGYKDYTLSSGWEIDEQSFKTIKEDELLKIYYFKNKKGTVNKRDIFKVEPII